MLQYWTRKKSIWLKNCKDLFYLLDVYWPRCSSQKGRIKDSIQPSLTKQAWPLKHLLYYGTMCAISWGIQWEILRRRSWQRIWSSWLLAEPKRYTMYMWRELLVHHVNLYFTNECASKILFFTWKNKIYIWKPLCNFLFFYYMKLWL